MSFFSHVSLVVFLGVLFDQTAMARTPVPHGLAGEIIERHSKDCKSFGLKRHTEEFYTCVFTMEAREVSLRREINNPCMDEGSSDETGKQGYGWGFWPERVLQAYGNLCHLSGTREEEEVFPICRSYLETEIRANHAVALRSCSDISKSSEFVLMDYIYDRDVATVLMYFPTREACEGRRNTES